jgi:hypothetical protein
VEIPKPLCTAIGFYSSDRASAAEITCHISGVPRAFLDKMTSELRSALKDIAQNASTEATLDMKRMRSVIERDRRQLLATAETRLTDVLCDPVITGPCSIYGFIIPSTKLYPLQISYMAIAMPDLWLERSMT